MRKDPTKEKVLMRMRRHKRIRAMLRGTAERPRLSVFRSAKRVVLQLIDDVHGKTLVAVKERGNAKESKKAVKTKLEYAREAGKLLAEEARTKGIQRVVFDRGGYAYHGRVQAVAEGAREGGLQF